MSKATKQKPKQRNHLATMWGEVMQDIDAPLPPLDLEAVEQALAAATPGPWFPFGCGDETKMIPVVTRDTRPLAYAGVKDRPNEANAVLIACAPTWLQQMRDEIVRLRYMLVEARGTFEGTSDTAASFHAIKPSDLEIASLVADLELGRRALSDEAIYSATHSE